jgi:two-component system cell cycle sensor histidine kinase/response regulator CckA
MSEAGNDGRIRALEAEVARLHTMLGSAPDFITLVTIDGRFLYLNRLAPGFRMEDVLGTSIAEYVPSEFQDLARDALRRAVALRNVQEYSTMGRISTDRLGRYLTRISPVVEGDEVSALVMTATDVTALDESRTLLQVAMDATGLGLWTYEPQFEVGSWDETTKRIFGVEPSEPMPTLDALVEQRIYPEDRALVRDAIARALQDGRFGPVRHRVLLPGGSVRWVAASGIVVRDQQQAMLRLVGSVQDISERRALEARLLEAEKLESIGRLAGGVSHDFNNMLTAILGHAEFTISATSLAEARAHAEQIRIAAERSAALTSQLLSFARRQVIEPKTLAPNDLIERLDTLLRRVLGEHIQVQHSLEAQGKVRADASQFEQVLLNLVTNARDAMPTGGLLRIATEDLVVRGPLAGADLPEGAYVRVSVTDTGAGISQEALPHLFEPFYTTRDGGTGLGLATCYGIVKQGGGALVAESRPQGGATFNIYWPRVDGPVDELTSPEPPQVAPRSVRGKILIVEDEDAVRTIMERTLSRANYHISSAATPGAALELARATEPFDALVTDLVMPGMGGLELIDELTRSWPSLRVLCVSGYVEDWRVREQVLSGQIHFLQKPFVPDELLDALRRTLS